jgi:hybrid cluster-associated redox disulfide protein
LWGKYYIVRSGVSVNTLCGRKENAMSGITKEMTIGEILETNSNVVPILMGAGMHCLGCPASQAESLEEAAMVHGIDIDELMKAIEEA